MRSICLRITSVGISMKNRGFVQLFLPLPSYHLDESLQRGVGLFFDEGRGGRSCKARRGLVL